MSSIPQLDHQASFEAVIEATQSLLNDIDGGTAKPDEIKAKIVHILSLDKGPRGFFASFLTDSRPLADHPPDSVLEAFKAVPDVTADLLVKNLAMSTAMVVFHQRKGDTQARLGSEQVQRRSQQLIKQLSLPAITEALKALQRSVSQPQERYSAFLERWNYDQIQKAAIAEVVSATLEP